MVCVSVIIPTFNSSAYIAESVESILRQTYQDFEIIIVDDGSSDGTRRIIERYAGRSGKTIRCLYQNNRGPGAARNHGMRYAQGKFIAFLDADDVWMPAKLSKQVSVMNNYPDIGLVYCDNYFVDKERRVLPDSAHRHALPSGDITLQFFYRYFMFTSAVLARRFCIEQTGFFREDIFVGEDYHYFIRLCYGRMVGLVDEKLLEKRVLKESLSNRDSMLNARNDLILLTDFIKEKPEFYRQHRGAIAQRLADYHFTIAYQWLRQGRNVLSLIYLFRSLRYRKSLRALKCAGLALIPYDFVRLVKSKISGTAYEYPGTEQKVQKE
jgi:glycosyltransferase involved in cell wall biosynthesis